MGKKRRRKQNVRRAVAKPAERKAAPVTPKPRKPEPVDQDAEFLELVAEKESLIYTMAYKRYLFESDGHLERILENGQCSARAYLSQIRAEEEGGQGWGPNVTPYEDRMNRSLQLRVIREKQKWIERCREQIIESIKESLNVRHEDDEQDDQSQPSPHLSDEALAKSEGLGSEHLEAPEADEISEHADSIEATAENQPILTNTAPAISSNADGP